MNKSHTFDFLKMHSKMNAIMFQHQQIGNLQQTQELSRKKISLYN